MTVSVLGSHSVQHREIYIIMLLRFFLSIWRKRINWVAYVNWIIGKLYIQWICVCVSHKVWVTVTHTETLLVDSASRVWHLYPALSLLCLCLWNPMESFWKYFLRKIAKCPFSGCQCCKMPIFFFSNCKMPKRHTFTIIYQDYRYECEVGS